MSKTLVIYKQETIESKTKSLLNNLALLIFFN